MKPNNVLYAAAVSLMACSATDPSNAAIESSEIAVGVDWEQESFQFFSNEDATNEDGWDVVTNLNGFRANDVASDGSFVYVVGHNWVPRWRVEKRNRITGLLEVAKNSDNTTNEANAIAINKGHMYVVGTTNAGIARIEKRFLVDTMALDQTFGTSGAIVETAGFIPNDIAIDDLHMYVAGHVGFDWRVEKRKLSSGELIAAYESGAVSTNLTAITIDEDHMYLVGNGGASLNWRIEKRQLSDGALDTGFDLDGVIEGDAQTANRVAQSVALSGDTLLVTGDNIAGDFYTRKFSKVTGVAEAAYASGVDSNLAQSIVVDGDYYYLGGDDNSGDWRIEKHTIDSGSLVTAFGANGVSTGNAVSVEVRAMVVDGDSIFAVGVNNNAARIRKVFQTDADTSTRIGLPHIGEPLAGLNTRADDHRLLDAFRLRLRLKATGGDVLPGADTFKLQYAEKNVDQCDAVSAGDWVDVTAVSSVIQSYDNTNATDQQQTRLLVTDAIPQTYQEQGAFDVVRPLQDGQSGLYDFSLTAAAAPRATAYCFRAVRDTGALLETYTHYPEYIPDPYPMLSNATLSCTAVNSTGRVPLGPWMPRIDIDIDRYPDALCNDGTTAAIYVRNAVPDSSEWVIHMMGGGGCSSAQGCADRWCSVGTNFSSRQMSTKDTPLTAGPGGILGAASINPFVDRNVVLLKYCSSDNWAGMVRGVQLDATHPMTGANVDVTHHFLGHRVFEAMIDTLRATYAPVEFTSGGVVQTMPNLDNASEIVLAGSSAGGGGAIGHLDWLNEQVAPHGTKVLGLFDATTDPDHGNPDLDFTTTTHCTGPRNICTYDEWIAERFDVHANFRGAFFEESCLATAANVDRCSDLHYVAKNHITTPFFVREDQLDSLHSDNFMDEAFRYDGPFTPLGMAFIDLVYTGVAANDDLVNLVYSQIARADMEAFEDIDLNAAEASEVNFTPGVFNPRCAFHETLTNTAQAFVEIDLVPNTMADYWNAWIDPLSVDPRTFYADTTVAATCN